MDQKMSATLADCYSEISDIWLSTAKIAREKIHDLYAPGPPGATQKETWPILPFWEAFERRCCIRAGYYARLAEQHGEPETRIIGKYAEMSSSDWNEIDAALKRAFGTAKKQRKRSHAS